MQNRRDQVQAHLFMVGRLNSSVLRTDPDAPETPNARTTKGLLIGLVIGVLAVAACSVYGLLVPGHSTAWRDGRSLIVVRETGARYLYVDGALRPVLNYGSAALLLGAGGQQVATQQVAQSMLRGVPRGPVIGIEGAPDSLPDPKALSPNGTWQVCASVQTSGGIGTPVTTVLVDAADTPSLLSDGSGVLVSGRTGDSGYLLWRGRRLKLPADRGALAALGYYGVSTRQVGTAFLDAVPAGPDLVAPPVPDRGEPGPEIAGRATRIGQLFAVRGGATHYYVLQRTGLVPLDQTQYDLLLADPGTRRGGYAGGDVHAITLSPTDLAGHLSGTGATPEAADHPATPPVPAQPRAGEALCVAMRSASATPQYGTFIVDADTLPGQPVVSTADTTSGCAPADLVAVGRGGGALVRALPAAGVSATGALYLVTDAGVRYPLTDAAATALGYGELVPEFLPHTLLDLLPSGPALDPGLVAVPTAHTGVRMSGCAP